MWVIIGAIIVSGVVTAFILNYNTSAPKKIEILDDGENVFIKADMNDNYITYRFKFSQDGGEDLIIDIDSNTLTIEELLSKGIVLGETYQISVCYLSENKGNNSEYSEPTSWTTYTYLSAPTLNYDADNDVVEWEEVDNADYYKVFVSGLDEFVTNETKIDMQSLTGGERTFYVRAYSNTSYYKESLPSNQLDVTIVHKFLPFESVDFNDESKTLTLVGSEELKTLNVYLNDTIYECVDFDISKSNGKFTYKVDLSLLYLGGMTVGATPTNEDLYNIYDGEITYAVGFEPLKNNLEESPIE